MQDIAKRNTLVAIVIWNLLPIFQSLGENKKITDRFFKCNFFFSKKRVQLFKTSTYLKYFHFLLEQATPFTPWFEHSCNWHLTKQIFKIAGIYFLMHCEKTNRNNLCGLPIKEIYVEGCCCSCEPLMQLLWRNGSILLLLPNSWPLTAMFKSSWAVDYRRNQARTSQKVNVILR